MKFRILLLLLAIILYMGETLAQSFLAKRDNTTATNAVVVFPGQSGKQAVLRTLDATGDNADAVAQLQSGVYVTRLTAAAGTSGTNLTVTSSSNFGTTYPIVIQRSDGTCTWHLVYAAGTNAVYTTAAIGTAASSGDYVWYMSHVATNAIASATVRRDGALWAGQVRAPLAVRVYTGSGTAERINNAVVEYVDN